VLVTNPKELEAIRQREADITKEKIAKILAAGANVVLTTKVRVRVRAHGWLKRRLGLCPLGWEGVAPVKVRLGPCCGAPPPPHGRALTTCA
jgi:hypothetical protein